MGHILIAEDEESISSLLTAAIGDMGHEVHVSPNGKHALETLRNNADIDLLITDMKMPKLDGRQLIKAIKKEAELVNLPIIIMSGYIGMSEIDDLLSAGALAFLSKPINLKTLEDYIDFAFKKKSAPTSISQES